MKNVLKFGLAAVAIGGILFSSCKKDSKTDILSGTTWVQTKEEVKLSTETTWTSNPLEPCYADDFSTFSANGTLTIDEGPTKCDPADPQTITGVWQLSSDGKILTTSGIAYTVEELTESKMVIAVYDFLGGGDDQRNTYVPK